MFGKPRGADAPRTGDRQYHIALERGELAEYILLPGDPDRTARISTRLDSIEFERRHREFASVTGTYRGLRISVVSTGIGTDNVEITVAEILAITERPTFIRIGSCGGLQPEMALGDLVVSTGAVRLESTTSYFVHDGYPAVADYEAVVALLEAVDPALRAFVAAMQRDAFELPEWDPDDAPEAELSPPAGARCARSSRSSAAAVSRCFSTRTS